MKEKRTDRSTDRAEKTAAAGGAAAAAHGIPVLNAALILLGLTLISAYLLCGLYARYTTEDTGRSAAGVAAYVFSADGGTLSVDLADIQEPGDSADSTFTVSNNGSGKVSEVAESYTVTAELNGSLPLTCTIRKGTDTVLNLDAAGASAAPDTNPVAEETSAGGSFRAAVGGTDVYTVTVTWPKDRNDLEYSRAGLSELVIIVTAQQED